jgi:hypothetical protein
MRNGGNGSRRLTMILALPVGFGHFELPQQLARE